METSLRSATQELLIGPEQPFVVIGERINPPVGKRWRPSSRPVISAACDPMPASRRQAGAQMLDVNAGVPGLDEAELLVELVRVVQEEVEVPLSIDSSVARALTAALPVCAGKPLVNSVTGDWRGSRRSCPSSRKRRRRGDRPDARRGRDLDGPARRDCASRRGSSNTPNATASPRRT